MKRTLQFFTLLALIFGSLGIKPASAASQPAAEPFLNADGSLDLTTGYSGTLDASHYNVTLDPVRGPIFSPLAVTSNAWNALGTGLSAEGNVIAVSGTDVYVGGSFANAGGVTVNNIAKWDGSTWSALGTGVNNYVYAIAISGTDVYVGGAFTEAGGVAVNYIAKWDGSAWSALGTGVNNYVYAIAVSGTDVYVGGDFTDAGNDPNADRIAKWNGSAWSALGTGANSSVGAIAISGTDIYAGGAFTDAGGVQDTSYIAKWDPAANSGAGGWSALGTGLNDWVIAIAVSGTDVYAGGSFSDAGNDPNADNIAKWDGSAWSAMGTGVNGWINAIAISGTDVYVGGSFSSADGVANTSNIAKWNGSTWLALGTGLNANVENVAISGMGVYAGGTFTDAGGDPNADYIALYATCATPVTVTNANDSGSGSLREALTNVCPGGTINFDNDYHILLDSTLAVTKDLTIDGGAHKIILDGQDTVRVMYIEWAPVSATVRNLTIQNGHATTSVGFPAIAGGGILNLGNLAVENVTFANNNAVDYGGGLYSFEASVVTNSTFSGNSASSGGAIYDESAGYSAGLAVNNSTFSGNSATVSGGAIDASLGSVNIINSIIANSTSGGNCTGTVINSGYNLDSGSTCGFGTTNHSLSNANPNLAALADNGGPTQTFALLTGSPAINAGSDAVCAGVDVGGQDQRGVTRPQGAHCDIGSYEVNFYTVTFNANGGSGLMSPQAANIPTALTLNAFTRAGYSFTGWNAAADGSDAAYDDGATYNFSADITLYAQWLDVTAPNTTITVKPAALTTSKNASFSFTSTEAGSTFMCKLEGANYSPCSSPKAYTNLSTTSHTFQVYAVDASGNPDSTPAIYTWTVRAERAKNGGFNTYAGASKIPTSWVKSTNFSASDGKDTSIKKDGAASVKIIGQTGKTKTLTQTLNINGVAGEKFTFSFWERGSAIPASGICRAQVLLYQGAAIKLTKTINCRTGTYNAFEKKTLSFNAPSSFNKVVIKFTYSKTSGTVWFDLVSLIK